METWISTGRALETGEHGHAGGMAMRCPNCGSKVPLGLLDNICPRCGRRYPPIGRVKIAIILVLVSSGVLLPYGIITFGLYDIHVLLYIAWVVFTVMVLAWQYDRRKKEG
jgi:hypothetical protein